MIPLARGTYQFSVFAGTGEETPDALVDVPDGFVDGDARYVVSEDEHEFLGLWTVRRIDHDACLHEADAFAPGPSVQDLADALVAQKATAASAPEPVVLAGYHGIYVELTGPADLSRCDRNPALWRKPAERGIYGDGQVDQLWILDVDGQRVVVDAAYGPTSSAAERRRLTAMVESMRFVAAGD